MIAAVLFSNTTAPSIIGPTLLSQDVCGVVNQNLMIFGKELNTIFGLWAGGMFAGFLVLMYFLYRYTELKREVQELLVWVKKKSSEFSLPPTNP